MRPVVITPCLLSALLLCTITCVSQIEELRQATGLPFSIDSKVIYGRVTLRGLEPGKKRPTIYVTMHARNMPSSRTTADDSGYYYFTEIPRESATLVVEANGVELARQTLMLSGGKNHRYDFVAVLRPSNSAAKPGTVSAKYAYERSEENTRLFEKAAAAIESKKLDKALSYLTRVVEADPRDFSALTVLGSVYFELGKFTEAQSVYRTALELRPDLTYAMVSLGKVYLAQKQPEQAIEILLKAAKADPSFAMSFRYLGEAYLQVQKGSSAIPALTEALRLEPVEMAYCHLLLASLYDAARAKHLAVDELKSYLGKVPNHPEKARMEKYIRDNPQPDVKDK